MVLESTYAGRDHPERLRTEYAFLKKVDEVVNRGGVVVAPAFAVGRTQEIALLLAQSRHKVWIDGMGKRVNEAYLDNPDYLASARKLRQAINRCEAVRSTGARKIAMQGDVIITTSGMLDGGPVLGYAEWIKDDPKNAILLTGYQVEGTNGRKLMDARKMDFETGEEDVKCEVAFFDFSAHADHKQLLRFVDKCAPKKIVLMHGDQREVLAKDLEGYEVSMPNEGEKIEV
jgi:putative mRNA 3-end processing factor